MSLELSCLIFTMEQIVVFISQGIELILREVKGLAQDHTVGVWSHQELPSLPVSAMLSCLGSSRAMA